MQTIHATSGVTVIAHVNLDMYKKLITNYAEVYGVKINNLDIPRLADNMAKIAAIVEGSIVVCASDRLLGDVGVVFNGGIKRAFDKDVWSTVEERQATLHDNDINVCVHNGNDYPEYWVAAKPSHIVVGDVHEEFKSSLSQLVGHYFGLLVK